MLEMHDCLTAEAISRAEINIASLHVVLLSMIGNAPFILSSDKHGVDLLAMTG